MRVTTSRGKLYDVEIGNSELRLGQGDAHNVYVRRVRVREVVDDRPEDDGQRSVFDIGLEAFFGGVSYHEMPENLTLLCARLILEEDGVPPPSREVHHLIFTREGLKNGEEETGNVYRQFAGMIIDDVIRKLEKAIKDTIERQRQIGFQQSASEIFRWSHV